ncbi:unnamed protein product [Clonostachys solani]|uniref:INO80 complex subunit B-like conserved region domain-containing protein n=1 Tax=Clonostachys solani TaxID=160281 RepID=A0A9P0EL82_9HYPO|nr:unnamed protein product [Clonostachys solani]
MSLRPRRSAAAKAKEVISVHARWADSDTPGDSNSAMSSRRSHRVSRDGPASPGDLSLTVKVPSSRARQATRGGSRRSDPFEGGEIIHGKRDRGGKKSYVVDSSPDDDEDEDDEMEEPEDEDAEGEEDMDVDAEGEDAEGDVDMDVAPPSAGSTIKIARPSSKPSARAIVPDDDEDDEEEDEDEEDVDDDDDDGDLSDPADSDAAEQTLGLGDETMADEDAEGEEIDEEGVTQIDGQGQGLDSDDEDGSQDGEPDLAKMTKRQRARFEDGPQEFMKLSDEVQAKKVFTAEELSMRRQEMARRRRNLSEKRNEEVKMETINKLLKKQAPKVNKKAAAAAAAAAAAGGEATPQDDGPRANPVFVRWVSSKNGTRVSVPTEMLEGPVGKVFQTEKDAVRVKRMVEEVA